MCRNHRGFIDATVACSKLGAHALYLNTAFAGPQITDVVKREKPVALIYDAEFEELVARRRPAPQALHRLARRRATAPEDPLLEDLIAAGDPSDVVPPESKGRVVILTSGTTGTPKGAQRKQPESLDPAAALFSKIPLRAARADDDRRADVPLVGLRALHARHGPGLDARPAAQVRSRGHA